VFVSVFILCQCCMTPTYPEPVGFSIASGCAQPLGPWLTLKKVMYGGGVDINFAHAWVNVPIADVSLFSQLARQPTWLLKCQLQHLQVCHTLYSCSLRAPSWPGLTRYILW